MNPTFITSSYLKACLLALVFIFISFWGYGQNFCNDCPVLTECEPCSGGLTSISLEYSGGVIVSVSASDDGGALATSVLSSTININSRDGNVFNGDVTVSVTYLSLPINLVDTETFPTSCPAVLQGEVIGNFIVLGGESEAGPLCCTSDIMTPPTFDSTPADINEHSDPNTCEALVTLPTLTATDACGTAVNVSRSHSSGPFPVGTTIVTYTSTDDFGNTTSYELGVTVVDNTAPIISDGPTDLLISAESFACAAMPIWIEPEATDNCSITSLSRLPTWAVFPLGTTTVIYTAKDAAGNTDEWSFDITVVDDTAPVLTVPADITVSTDAGQCGAVITYASPSATDNCSVTVSQIDITGLNSEDEFPVGTTELTYRAVDPSGNSVEETFTITVTDDEDPVLTVPADITVTNDVGVCGAEVDFVAPSATDNCSATVTQTGDTELTNGDVFPIGTTTLTYTAVDPSGNSVEETFTITVTDDEDPVLTVPADITVTNDAGVCGAEVDFVAPSATDNCSATVTQTGDTEFTNGDIFPIGTTTLTYRSVDPSGNSVEETFTITVTDDEDPVLTVPADITVTNDVGICGAEVGYAPPSATDNCSATISQTDVSGFTNGDVFPIGTTSLTYTAVDPAGNSVEESFTVTVIDDEDPVLTVPSDISVSTDPELCTTTVFYSNPTATDNCNATVTQTDGEGLTSGDDFPIGTTTLIYRAVDDAGNFNEKTFTITVTDNENPQITCPSDQTLETDASCNALLPDYTSLAVATDNCDMDVTITQSPAVGEPLSGFGTVQQVTLTVTDNAGNESTCTFNVTLIDTIDPEFADCPTDRVVNISSGCGAPVSWTPPVASDNCGFSVVSSHDSGNIFPVGITTVVYTVTDEAGNSAVCSFKVEVIDNVAPLLTACPGPVVVNSSSTECGNIATWTEPTVSEECVTLTRSHDPGSFFSDKSTIVTYTATDLSGNVTTCSFDVKTRDNTKPEITGCPSTITATAPEGSCEAGVTWSSITATDNCGTVTLVNTHDPGSLFPVGTTQVTYTFTDDSGNFNKCNFDVVVNETVAPIISNGPGDQTVSADASCSASVSWEEPLATDNCNLVSFTSDISSGSTFTLGTTPVTYTAVDGSGNITTHTFNVIVIDDTAPVITIPENITVNADENCKGIAEWEEPVITDNCSSFENINITSNYASGHQFDIGETTVTYTATDEKGNTATASFTVTIEDTTPPVFEFCPPDILINSHDNQCFVPVNWDKPIVSDNCGVVSEVRLENPGPFPVGTTTVSYIYSDAAGNEATCSFDITIVDVAKPELINLPSDIIAYSPQTSCSVAVPWDPPTANDNCNPVEVESNYFPGQEFSPGFTTVVYTAIDPAGNISKDSFTITVIDSISPIISTCHPDVSRNLDENCQYLVEDFRGLITAEDNCNGDVELLQVPTPGTLLQGAGTSKIITITAIDSTGNEKECYFTLNLLDDLAPEIFCPENQDLFTDAECNAVIPDYTNLALTDDNCDNLIEVTQTPAPGTVVNGVGTIEIITLTATDNSGNTTACSFTTTLIDNLAPEITCPEDQELVIDADCNAVVPDYASLAFTGDNCDDNIGITQTPTPGTVVNGGVGTIQTISLTVTDNSGNTAACSFTTTLIDILAPEITCPEDQELVIDADCNAVVPDYTSHALTEDNCDDNIEVTQTPAPGTILNGAGNNQVVTLTATDISGNTKDCSFTIILVDNVDPEITCLEDQELFADSECKAVLPDYTNLTVTADNCSNNIEVKQTPAPGTPLDGVGSSQLVILTATDNSGNAIDCSFRVTLMDNVAPEITCPDDQDLETDENCNVKIPDYTDLALTDDSCDEIVEVTQIPSPGTILNGAGTNQLVTLTATDNSGNTIDCSFTVTLIDNLVPEITCPDDQEGHLNENCVFIIPDYTNLAALNDNCDDNPVVTQLPVAGTELSGDVREYTVTLTASDINGNINECSFLLVLVDNTEPEFTCLEDQSASVDENCEFVIPDYTQLISATDNCTSDVDITYSQSPAAGTIVSGTESTQIITLTATDNNENAKSCSFTLTLVDDVAPEISCPNPQELFITANCEAELPDYSAEALVADYCGTTITQSPEPGTVLAGLNSNHEVTLTVTDENGNAAFCTFNVTLVDKASPVFSECPADIITSANQNCEATVNWQAPSVADNCVLKSVSSNYIPGSVFSIGVTTVVYTAIDESGNQSTCSFNVIVENSHLPVITGCPDEIIAEAPESGEVEVAWSEPEAELSCGELTFTSTHQPGDLFSLGTTEVTYTASDGAGNIAICSFNVIIEYENIDFSISKVITPNGDGINDLWELKNIERYSNNRVVIVDRWGSEIFVATGYDNHQVVWRGENKNGGPLPSGTYFYYISVTLASEVVEKSGYIELIR